MRQSLLFTKTRKEPPKDEVAKNAELLIRAGFIDKLYAGIYSFLPLGYRVLSRIEQVIRFHMNTLGAQEILMPALHPHVLWTKTGRWETMDDLYKIKDASGRAFALGPTHEEIVTPLVSQFVSSYKDLPFSVFQIQDKFRMEKRAKSGVLRAREFIMKDLYSFHADERDLQTFYERVKDVYHDIFHKVGIGDKTHVTFASGGSFSRFSHEFQTVTEAGEDIIYVCDDCGIAVNEEIRENQQKCPECGSNRSHKEKAIEVGNIFILKDRFSKPFNLQFQDEKGNTKTVLMGCYGIGLGRLMGAVVEVLSDEKGLVWPVTIAPYQFHLLTLDNDEKTRALAEEVYQLLCKAEKDVLFDDRDVSAGTKLVDADLIGIPIRVVVSTRSIENGGVEVKFRADNNTSILTPESLLRIYEHVGL